ncbi:MAG TPA: efflux RND transporter periplasmic adaptor subunit [Sphingomonadaceae bacterium]|nr:efflux RND transporter periplasmic adaptor subunit [Sphingomonadaceae bacterium]
MNYETTVDSSNRPAFVNGVRLDGVAPDGRRRRLLMLGLAIIVVVVALLIAMQFMTSGAGEAAGESDVEQAPTVTVSVPGNATIEGTITATGSLAARREMPVGVVGEGGRVLSVPVEAGQWVRAGQILAVIDRSVQTQQQASSAANIEVAKADAELAQANLDRAMQLIDRGFISQADVDRLTANRDAAVARVRVAEAQYAERTARNAQLNIVAPAAGLVLERNVEPGQVVSPGSGALFSIAKDGQMELLAEVGEVELASLTVGSRAEVAIVGSNKSFVGQVWQISPTINLQDRQGIARIALDYAPELRPGGFATATINSGTISAPMLPESAILSDDEGSYVYIVGPDKRVARRSVETGAVTTEGIAVVSGLDGSEQVVMRAGGFLEPGDLIRPQMEARAE